MERLDKIVFGDNQFFGINHMSQEKAQKLAQKFSDINNIIKVYDLAIKSGIRAIMLNSNNKATEICDYFREHIDKYKEISWYPSIPYPHKYANLIAEKGITGSVIEVLIKDNPKSAILGILGKGGAGLISFDAYKMMEILIDAEMKIFKGLNIKVIFLQNVITDLILGFNLGEVFEKFCIYIRKKYKAIPGFITQNMPYLVKCLKDWGIKEVAICTSINKIGYLMFPDIESYIKTCENNNPDEYQIMAMSPLASGAISPKEAYEFLNKIKVQSVVFGASSKEHIEEALKLINI